MSDTPDTVAQTPDQPQATLSVTTPQPSAAKGTTTVLAGAALAISAAALVMASLPYSGVGIGPQVRGYLLNNPQILDEMITARQQAEDQSVSSAIDAAAKANPQLLAHDARDPAVGPENAKVTVIQFFDYRCPGCKAVSVPYREMMARHPDVRFVFKEWPILDNGETVTSNYAARAALAANQQGKFMTVHAALMDERALTVDVINQILQEQGVDMAAAQKAIASPDTARHITDIHTTGVALGLRGTPTFFVNGKASASIDPAEVERMIEAVQ